MHDATFRRLLRFARWIVFDQDKSAVQFGRTPFRVPGRRYAVQSRTLQRRSDRRRMLRWKGQLFREIGAGVSGPANDLLRPGDELQSKSLPAVTTWRLLRR